LETGHLEYRDEDNIKIYLWEIDEPGSGSCPIMGSGISKVTFRFCYRVSVRMRSALSEVCSLMNAVDQMKYLMSLFL
jgi:hypothetical protein